MSETAWRIVIVILVLICIGSVFVNRAVSSPPYFINVSEVTINNSHYYSIDDNRFNQTIESLDKLFLQTRQEVVVRESKQCANTSSKSLKELRVTGISMTPTIKPWSIILIKDYDAKLPLVESDIVAVKINENLTVLHRVSGVYPDYFLTQGDNNIYPDTDRRNYSQIEYIACGALFR